MSESMVWNELQEKFRVFRKIRRAYGSFLLVAVLAVISLCSEIVGNNRPILMKYHGHYFAPVFKTYAGDVFELGSPVEPSYKELTLQDGDWAVWPLLHWGFNESNSELSSYPSPPSHANLLGTDDRGRDILTRLIYGFRVSFLFGIVNMVIAVVLALLIGGLQGYLGGKTDLIGQRLLEIWSALPYLYVLIFVVNVFEPGVPVLILVSSLFVWLRLSYYIRAEFLKIRKLDFVNAAKAMGAKHGRIIVQHIFPNALTPIVTFAPFIISIAIANLAVLDFLGLGVPAPTASLGELLRQGRSNFITAWWLALFPFIVLAVLTSSLYFIGEGLRESFDPRRAK